MREKISLKNLEKSYVFLFFSFIMQCEVLVFHSEAKKQKNVTHARGEGNSLPFSAWRLSRLELVCKKVDLTVSYQR